MADGLSLTVNSVADTLSREEGQTLLYLCSDLLPDGGCSADDLRGALLSLTRLRQAQTGHAAASVLILMELMFRIKRFDILKNVLGTSRQEVEGILRSGYVVSEYRVLMASVSEDLEREELRSLIFLLGSTLPRGKLDRAKSFLDVVVELERLDEVSSEKVDLIESCLRNIHRVDLAKKVQAYQMRGAYTGQRVQAGFPARSPVQNSCLAQRTLFSPPPPSPPIQCTMEQLQTQAQAPENLTFPVSETGTLHRQDSVEEYRMEGEFRGVCVIIDCVGCDGDVLKQTFERLRFRVLLHTLLGLDETWAVLGAVARGRELQGAAALACCLLSRGSDSRLLATDAQGPGLRLEDVRQLFGPASCPALAGKPKLFFTQSYSVPGTAPDDGCLETDGLPSCSGGWRPETLPVAADVVWSACRADVRLLERQGHSSAYLRALCNALLRAQGRRTPVSEVLTEVNRDVYAHNQRNPDQTYFISQSHTLRKNLYL